MNLEVEAYEGELKILREEIGKAQEKIHEITIQNNRYEARLTAIVVIANRNVGS